MTAKPSVKCEINTIMITQETVTSGKNHIIVTPAVVITSRDSIRISLITIAIKAKVVPEVDTIRHITKVEVVIKEGEITSSTHRVIETMTASIIE